MAKNSMNPLIELLEPLSEHLGKAPLRLLESIAEALDSIDIENLTDEQIVLSKDDVLHILNQKEGKPLSEANVRQRLKQINQACNQLYQQGFGKRNPLTLSSRKHSLCIEFVDGFQAYLNDHKLLQQLARSTQQDTHFNEKDTIPPEVQIISPEIAHLQVFISHAWEQHSVEQLADQFVAQLEHKLVHLPEKWRDQFTLSIWLDREKMRGDETFEKQTDRASRQAAIGVFLTCDKWYSSAACQLEADNFHDTQANPHTGKKYFLVQLNGKREHADQRYKNRPHYPELWDNSCSTLQQLYNLKDYQIDDFLEHLRDGICSAASELISAYSATQNSPHQNWRERFRKSGVKPNELETEVIADKFNQPTATTYENDGKRIKILPLLEQWAIQPEESQRVTVLLGSFGSGKTVTTQLLAERLSNRLSKGEAHPIPVYLDLRRLIGHFSHNTAPENFQLKSLIAASLHSDTDGFENTDGLVDFLRREPCVILFDGLDEVGTRLGMAKTAKLFRQLLDIVPIEAWQADIEQGTADWHTCPTRLLITCRTHFFRDHVEETGMLTGQHRHPLSATNRDNKGDPVQRFYMAPFTPQQVKNYLTNHLGNTKGRRAFQQIEKIHDLPGLASKPLMARLITEKLPDITADARAGRVINTASIYQHLFRTSLERDRDKQLILEAQDRARLLEALSVMLWQSGRSQLSVDELDEWFDHYAVKHPGISLTLQSGVEVRQLLHTELHNASLLVRVHDQGFVFAHTSFYEYFLARALYHRLMDGSFNKLEQLPSVSHETLIFVHEIAAADTDYSRQRCNHNIQQLLQAEFSVAIRQFIADLLLSVPVTLRQLLVPGNSDLSSLDLAGRKLHGTAEAPLELSGIKLTNTRLYRLQAQHVIFDACDWQGAYLGQAQFSHCTIQYADMAPSGLASARFFSCRFNHNHQHWVSAATFLINCQEPAHPPAPDSGAVHMKCSYGHTNAINSAAFSPDGQRIITASDDNSARIWDAQSGNEISQLTGHSSLVLSAAFSPDGQRIITASHDNSARIWDAQSGNEISQLTGHSSSINSAAFSPDGQRIITASDDGTIKIWLTSTGQLIKSICPLTNSWIVQNSDHEIVRAGNNAWRYLHLQSNDCMNDLKLFSPDLHPDWEKISADS